MRRDRDLALAEPDLQQARIDVDQRAAAKALHDPGMGSIAQVQEQVGGESGFEIQACGDQRRGQRLVGRRAERDRGSEPERLEVALQRLKVGEAAFEGRFRAHRLEPDHPAAVGVQTERPVQIYPAMATALRIVEGASR